MMFMLVQVLIINLQMHLFYIIFTHRRCSDASLIFLHNQEVTLIVQQGALKK